jgi:PAS domain S-box-containing protein
MSRRLNSARLTGIVLLAAFLGTLGTLSFLRRIDAAEPDVGVRWASSSIGPVAVEVDPAGPARAAGVEEGDVLLRVDGRAVPNALDAESLPWDWPAGGEVALELERGAETVTLRLRAPWVGRTEPYGYLAVVGLAFFVSGGFIAVRWPNVRGGRLYSLLAACLFTLLVLSHTGRADGLDWTVYALDVLAGSFAPALLLHFTLALSRRAVPARGMTVLLAYVPGALLLLAALLPLVPTVGGVRLAVPLLATEELRERLETLYLACAVLLSVLALTRAHSRSSSTMHRSQMRWLLWGLLGGMMPFVAFYAVPFSIGASDLPRWAEFTSVLPMLVVPAAFTAALARYRLYDLSLLLRRGVSYVTTVFFAVAVYAATREAIDGLFDSRSAPRYIGILVALAAFPQIRKLVRAGVDRAFYRERYSYRATLLDWARELSAETDLERLLERLRRRVCETLELSEALVLIRTGEGAFETVVDGGRRQRLELRERLVRQLEQEIAVSLPAGTVRELEWARWLFPMKVKGRVRALLVTADRQAPEEPLSTEDRALLGTLSAHAATAIDAARLVREVRLRAEEIEHLHARQERIIESSAVGLLMTDAEGHILAWNRALEAIYGLSRADAIGRGLSDVFPLHLVRRIENEARSIPVDEQARIYRYTLVNRSGQRLVVNLAVTPAPSGDADSRARVITFDDVSERVKLEEQVLQQERLAALGLLAAGVAHEVNTPLTGISSYAQMLLEDLAESDPRREALEKIETQTRRASNIVNSLLNLARDDDAEFESLSLNDTVREVLQLFEPQIKRRDIRIETRLDEGSTEILGHRGKIQQVLLNLLLNARDAVDSGGRIRVCTRRDGERVSLEIVDDGVGIAEEDLPRIFDPFFTTKGKGQGTGLGLSISYGIVQEHRGEMSVESTPGESTRFCIELPAASSVRAMA